METFNERRHHLDGVKPKYSIGETVYLTMGRNSSFKTRIKGISVEIVEDNKVALFYYVTCNLKRFREYELFTSINDLFDDIKSNVKEE